MRNNRAQLGNNSVFSSVANFLRSSAASLSASSFAFKASESWRVRLLTKRRKLNSLKIRKSKIPTKAMISVLYRFANPVNELSLRYE